MDVYKVLVLDKDYLEEKVSDEVTSYLSLKCGYTTNSLFKIGSTTIDEVDMNTAELIKSLKFSDEGKGLIWYPVVINFPSRGMIFPDGTNTTDWKWCYAPAIEIPEGERQKYPVAGSKGEYHTKRIDMSAREYFEQDDFKSACIKLGMILQSQN